jgi:hypothetical protein
MASLLDESSFFFFSNSTNQTTRPEIDFWSLDSMDVASNTLGCYLVDENDDLVFIHYPRETVLECTGDCTQNDILALRTLQEGKGLWSYSCSISRLGSPS